MDAFVYIPTFEKNENILSLLIKVL